MTFDGIIEALGGRLGAEIENAGGASAVEIMAERIRHGQTDRGG